MAGRAVARHTRIHLNGYNLSCYARRIGPLAVEFGEADLTAPMCDEVRGYLPTQGAVTAGELNGVFDTASEFHGALSARAAQTLMVPIGMRAAPAMGDPAFCALVEQLGYHATEDGGAVTVNVPFGGKPVTAAQTYCQPWGVLLHAYAAETAANTAVGYDGGAASSLGGYMMYQAYGNGTATIKVQDAAVNANGSFADLLTSGVISTLPPAAGIVELAHNATVRKFLRWQIVLGTATTVSFALAFVRASY